MLIIELATPFKGIAAVTPAGQTVRECGHTQEMIRVIVLDKSL